MLKKNNLIFSFILLNLVFYCTPNIANAQESFDDWLSSYKMYAIKNGVSKKTVTLAFKNVKFLEQVIKYDRQQPEFFEDTITYVTKRANLFRATKAKKLLKINKELFTRVENKFFVEKEILLALWGIETNFGKHVGKMDIISCLSTLSFDKRRRDFFSSELLALLKLIDNKLVNKDSLFGSWAGAFGNFQFMPSSIKTYAIDFDNNNKIELKSSLDDALASAANYISSIGWNYNEPCFYRVKLSNKISSKYINSSARSISNRMNISSWKKNGILRFDGKDFKSNSLAALILPDGNENSPAYLVFENYEKILQWNRSLRFGISVCTLANMIKT